MVKLNKMHKQLKWLNRLYINQVITVKLHKLHVQIEMFTWSNNFKCYNWRKCISRLIGTTVKTAQTARSGSADRSSSHG